MADDLQNATGQAEVNPFEQIAAEPDAPQGADANPFGEAVPAVPDQTSAPGAFIRSAARSVGPAAGALAGAGAGAKIGSRAGAAIGALFGPADEATVPLGSGIGAFVGGVGGSIAGAYGAGKFQDYTLSKMPDDWVEALGQDDRQQRLDQAQHGTASFLGGLVPYALTMSPFGAGKAVLPENATAFQKLMANPVTARVFGGALMGGMELGQEAVQGPVDWQHVAIATGFGMVFNRPNRLGQLIENAGAKALPFPDIREPSPLLDTVAPAPAPSSLPPVQPGLVRFYHGGVDPHSGGGRWVTQDPTYALGYANGRPDHVWYVDIPTDNPLLKKSYDDTGTDQTAPYVHFEAPEEFAKQMRPYAAPPGPTIAQAGDLKVMGPGITEDVFHGSHDQEPSAQMAAQDIARAEAAATTPPPEPDLHAVARQLEPELFDKYDALSQRRDEFRQWISEFNNPPDEQFQALQTQRAALEAQLAQHVESQSGYQGGADARRMRAQIRDLQREEQILQDRRSAFAEGRAQETPEVAAIRQHLLATDIEMRDLAPDVSAAYRRAQDHTASELEPAPETGGEVAQAPEPTPAATPAAETGTTQSPAPPVPAKTPMRPMEEQLAFIANDLLQKFTKAGRPLDESTALSQLLADHYQARAERFGGARGTPEELYSREGPEIRAGRTRAKAPEMAQGALGKIRFRDDERPLITLMQDANASTAIHETGHQWLEELLSDANHELAPESLKQDAATVRAWLGAADGEDIKTRQHEKFARGFEQYMREGVAPSARLARVFAQFKDWLTTIYQTLRGLGKPINEDIRQVFDRMLATEPQRTVVAPERTAGPTLADIHEADAAEIEPHEADAAMDRVISERDRYLADQPPEIQRELQGALAKVETAINPAGAAATPGEVGGVASGHAEVERGGAGPGPDTAGGTGGAKPGKIEPGGGEAGRESAELGNGPEHGPKRGSSAGEQLAPGPSTLFGAAESPFVDKAGNIRLENLTSQEDVARAIRAAAEANDDFIGDRRGVVTDGQVTDLAQALGMTYDELLKRKVGQAFNAEQVVAARKLLIQSATDVFEAMKRAAAGTDDDVMNYAQVKDRHQMIQAQVAGITAEAGRALRAFRDISGEMGTGAANADQIVREATGRTLFQLRVEARLGAGLDSPLKVSKFLQDAQKRSFGRMLLEYWINGLISGLSTHGTYTIGNTVATLNKATAETATAAAIGQVRSALGREGERVRFGEVGAQLGGAYRGLPASIKAAIDAAKTGVTTLLPGEDMRNLPPGAKKALSAYGGGSKIDTLPFQPGSELVQPAMLDEATRYSDALGGVFGAIRGIRDGVLAAGNLVKAGGVEGAPLVGLQYEPLGYIPDIQVRGMSVLPVGSLARAPGRLIAAIHSFFRSMNYSMEKNAMAYRSAATEGLSGTAFDSRVADLRQNPSEPMMEAARGVATDITLMGHGGEFMRKLSALTNATVNLPLLGETQILKFIDPFVHIAANVIDQSLVQRTPLGLLSSELRADLMGKNGNVAADKAAARMLVGTAYAVAFGSLAAEGYVTGAGPSDPNESAVWRMAGNQPHSVRIGDTWYNVGRLGPLGMLMGLSADMYDVAHVASEGDVLKAAAAVHHAIVQNILDESFMRGPAELMQAIEDPGRYGERYISNFLSSFVPYSVGLGQMARASDPYSRQARTILDAIRSKVPGVSQSLFPRRDIFGEPLPNLPSLGGRGISAIYMSQVSKDPVIRALADLQIGIGPVERKIRNIDLTDQQYDDLSRIAGRQAKMRLDTIVKSPDFARWPDQIKTNVIKEVISQSRESARGVVMMKYPQIVKDATVAMKEKVYGKKPQ